MSTLDQQSHNLYHVQFDVDTGVHMSNLSQVCRRVRHEYLSLVLAKHRVTIRSLEAARQWHSMTNPSLPNFLPVLNIELDSWILLPNTSGRRSMFADFLPWIVTLHAKYRVISSPCKKIVMHFNFRCPVRDWALDSRSKKLIRRCLDQRLLSGYYFGFTNFLRMTEQMASVELSGKIVVPPEREGMKVVHHEPSFWVDQSVYPRQVEHTRCYEYVECEGQADVKG